MKNKIIITICFMQIATNFLFASNISKEKVFNDFIKKDGNIKTINAVCSNPEAGFNDINIIAKRGNKYRIKTNHIEIYCDGNAIWNYNPAKKSVLISNFDAENTQNIFSIDNLFFNVFPNLEPTKLQSVLSNKKNKQYRLDLYNKNRNTEIKEVYLYLDANLTKIEGIEIITNNIKIAPKWNIKKLEINKSIADDAFIFKVPQGVEEIDTR
jgi:outer membrane lipoprotein-sorting protein